MVQEKRNQIDFLFELLLHYQSPHIDFLHSSFYQGKPRYSKTQIQLNLTPVMPKS